MPNHSRAHRAPDATPAPKRQSRTIAACRPSPALLRSRLAVLLAALAAPALAREATTTTLERCLRDPDESAQVACLQGLREHAERRLDALYAATRRNLATLAPGAGDHLADGHQAWTAMRDADCALLRESGGVPGQPLKPEAAHAWCMAEHALDRVHEVDSGLRRPTASAAATLHVRRQRSEALSHKASVNAAIAAGEPPASHECRYESAIGTPPPEHEVALTFDDGPEEGETEQVLEVLARHHIRAAFFMIGEKAREHPELVEKVAAAGHLVVGNHSWSHPNFHDIDAATQQDEVAKGQAELHDRLNPLLFRYPYGNSSCATNDYLHAQGYRIVGWHVDSCDWAFDQTGSVGATDARICEVAPEHQHDYVAHVVSQVEVRKGGIVLMHEIHPHTLHKLEEVVDRLEALGYRFGSIDDPEFAASLR